MQITSSSSQDNEALPGQENEINRPGISREEMRGNWHVPITINNKLGFRQVTLSTGRTKLGVTELVVIVCPQHHWMLRGKSAL